MATFYGRHFFIRFFVQAMCPILEGVGHMKNWPSKMDLFLELMLKTFEIQTFFGYNPLLGSYLAHIKKYFESIIVYYAKQPTFGEQIIPFLRVILQ